jgi:putative FmdB family regulatory protein
MPLYQYQCLKCGHIMEKLEKAGTPSRPSCEKCGSRRMEKMMPSFSVGAMSKASGIACPTGTCSLS